VHPANQEDWFTQYQKDKFDASTLEQENEDTWAKKSERELDGYVEQHLECSSLNDANALVGPACK
jgi:hypothetical protein